MSKVLFAHLFKLKNGCEKSSFPLNILNPKKLLNSFANSIFTLSMAIDTGMAKTGKRVAVHTKYNLMRYYLFAFAFCFSQTIFAQEMRSSIETGTTDFFPDCPDETCPAASVSIDQFNFHKPRTSCSSGFGLCVKVSLSVGCIPCIRKNVLSDGKVNAFFRWTGKELSLHLPLELNSKADFSKEDMTSFEVEESTISVSMPSGESYWVKAGVYPVVVIGDEYVVNMKLLE